MKREVKALKHKNNECAQTEKGDLLSEYASGMECTVPGYFFVGQNKAGLVNYPGWKQSKAAQ